jgi:hypothetical protein
VGGRDLSTLNSGKISGHTLVPFWHKFLEYFCHKYSSNYRTILVHQKFSYRTGREWKRIFIHFLVQNLSKHNTLNNNNN